MGEYQRVVVGTDGSEAAQDAVTVAGMVATRLLAPLTVVTTWKESSLRAGHDGDWALETTLQAAARLAAENVTAVDRLELPGAAAPMLLDVAGQQPDTVLVLGARAGWAAPRPAGPAPPPTPSPTTSPPTRCSCTRCPNAGRPSAWPPTARPVPCARCAAATTWPSPSARGRSW
ncbi:universal stress protein [Nocardia thailandica]|uniref:universal stress protein n=1 Tax=Nocardia thailandica TaxID=257275 RepID=UPI0012FA4B87